MVVHYPNFWKEMNDCSSIVSEDKIELIKMLVNHQKKEGKKFPIIVTHAEIWARWDEE